MPQVWFVSQNYCFNSSQNKLQNELTVLQVHLYKPNLQFIEGSTI